MAISVISLRREIWSLRFRAPSCIDAVHLDAVAERDGELHCYLCTVETRL